MARKDILEVLRILPICLLLYKDSIGDVVHRVLGCGTAQHRREALGVTVLQEEEFPDRKSLPLRETGGL